MFERGGADIVGLTRALCEEPPDRLANRRCANGVPNVRVPLWLV